MTNFIAVGDTGACYKCGFQSFCSALSEAGAGGWIRFTKNSLDFDYLEMYTPGFEYRTYWYRDIGTNVDHLSNFIAVVGTSHKLLDWFENDTFEEQSVRLVYEHDHDENHFVNLWDSPFFILLQVMFFCWSVFNIVLSVKNADEDGISFVGPACAFVSHSWSYKFKTLLSVLEEYQLTHLDEGTHYYFLDMFAINQHNVASDDLLISLQNVVSVTNKILLVMTTWSNPRPLRRVWCLWEILQAVKLKATIRMVLPSKEKDAFMLALQSKYSQVENTLASIDVVKANATVESDKWMIFAEIERSLGSREKIEKLCESMGLEVNVTSPRKEGESESDWLNRQSEKFFLKCSARGSADEGGVVQWDHIDRTITRIDDGAILYKLHDGLNRMNNMLSKEMCKALSDVMLNTAMRSMKPVLQSKQSLRFGSIGNSTGDSTKENEES